MSRWFKEANLQLLEKILQLKILKSESPTPSRVLYLYLYIHRHIVHTNIILGCVCLLCSENDWNMKIIGKGGQ